jgi:subtilisin family serine protease
MKRHLLRTLLALLLLWPFALFHSASSQDDVDPQAAPSPEKMLSTPYRPGQVLVKFRAEIPQQDRTESLGALDLPILGQLPGLEVQRVAAPEGQERQVVEALNADPSVEYAELDYVVHATIVPDDPDLYLQWGLAKIQAEAAWEETTGSSDVVIAIVDTGVDLNHPDLNDKIVPGWDFVNDDNSAQDDHGHGTHVAGIAAAETDNNRGVAGMSWGARIMPIKVLRYDGDGYYSDVAQGVQYACNHGASIINLSLGGSNPSSTLKDALEQAYAGGCVIVAAAGNSGENKVDYPARYGEAIAVAATDQADAHVGFSDTGPQVEVAAPGVDIYSTLWTPSSHTYGWKRGTSMSTASVSGLSSLVWTLCPELTNAQLRDVLKSTTKDLGATGWDPYFGYGRIRAQEAVQAANPPPILAVNQDEMLFLADATLGPWPQTLLVSNGAPCALLDWTTSESESWLDADPDSGQASSSQAAGVAVSVDKSGLSTGTTYNTTLSVDSSTLGVQEAPQPVDVKFVYSDTPLKVKYFPLGMSH